MTSNRSRVYLKRDREIETFVSGEEVFVYQILLSDNAGHCTLSQTSRTDAAHLLVTSFSICSYCHAAPLFQS